VPSFSFNAGDMSGRMTDDPETPPPPTTPSRSSGHKRQSSTFVGGHGVADAISTSPTKSNALPIPRRRHGRDNSRVTLSGQEWSKVMAEADQHQPRLSTSLPNTPLERPGCEKEEANRPAFGTPPGLDDTPNELDNAIERPPSRPRVEFSENVEYIPRPLSTISSETGSSMSTVRGHSVNNSISSVLSMTAPSPPSSRARAPSLEPTMEDEPKKLPRSSIDMSKRVDKEGQWLRRGSSRDSLKRPITAPTTGSPNVSFSDIQTMKKACPSHKKRQSFGRALGLDRRRSEPAINNAAEEPSRLSAISLQEPGTNAEDADSMTTSEGRSSSQRLRDWARSKMSRRRPHSVYLATPERYQTADASPVSEPATAETDLDTVFSLDTDEAPVGSVRALPAVLVNPSTRHTWSNSPSADSDDLGNMLDLDAALGPFNAPDLGAQKPRRELHSSRGTRDFGGPGGHYQPHPLHRRAESAPMLTPFDYSRTSTPPQASMEDVFEEEEEEDEMAAKNTKINSIISGNDAGTGVEIVDSDLGADHAQPSTSLDDALRIQNSLWEADRPATSYGTMSSRLSAPMLDRRSSVIEDTIVEESSPVEPAIVEAYEEPRTHSLTKSSDSSETPTIMATQTGLLALPDGQSTTTPETYNSSVFSSPDLARRQGSFETSRVGTSASSMTDNRTMSSCTTGEPAHRGSVDDVPSLTSSRSTMLSTMQANVSRRDLGGLRTPSVHSSHVETMASEQRRKRNSIQSLSQLMGSPFGPRQYGGQDGARPRTATDGFMTTTPKKKEHNRLKKLMFWKSKTRQGSSSTVL